MLSLIPYIFLLNSALSVLSLRLAEEVVGQGFSTSFDFWAQGDLNDGFVNYVTRADSAALIQANSSYFRMATDSKTPIASGRGRNSVRLESRQRYGDGVFVLDVDHIPTGCGVWPAWWTTVASGWPVGGEIDIIESYNVIPPPGSPAYLSTFNASLLSSNSSAAVSALLNASAIDITASLHVAPGCNIAQVGAQTGRQAGLVCDSAQNYNSGCGIELGVETRVNRWNAGGGGWYVLWRDFKSSGRILVYAIPRNSSSVPAGLTFPSASLDPSTWTLRPSANFTLPHCAKSTFTDHAIVINTALCGSLAGTFWSSSGCPGISCDDFVRSHPEAMLDAWWGIRSLRVYAADGKSSAASRTSSRSMGALAALAVLYALLA